MIDLIRAIEDRFDEVLFQLAEAQRKFAAGMLTGKVKSYDPATDKAVVDLGFDTHEIPQASRIGDWGPLEPGQMVTVMSPGGDLANAFLVPGGYHDGQTKPSNRADERVMSRGGDAGVLRSRKGGVAHVEVASRTKFRIKIGGQYFAIRAEALEPTGGD